MYHNYIWWQKEVNLFQIYLIYAEQSLADFFQVVLVPAYISTIISAAADEGPDEIMCFPSGSTLFINFPNKNVKNIKEIDVSLCELFRERMSLYRHICELFQRENEWTVFPLKI